MESGGALPLCWDTTGKEMLQRDIDSTGYYVDSQVYPMYGLPVREIKIVEGEIKYNF